MSYRFRENTDEKIYNCRENCEMYLYRNVNADSYKEYIRKLTDCGYVVLNENIYADNYFCNIVRIYLRSY